MPLRQQANRSSESAWMPQTLYSIGVYLICTLQSPLFLGIEVDGPVIKDISFDQIVCGDYRASGELGLTLYIGLHGVLFSLIMTLASLLQVKYQLAKESPFDTHNGFMLTFIVVTLVYAMALLLELILRAQNSTYCAILGNLNILAGALAAVLLLLILVPFVGWTIFAIWLAYSIKAACDLYRELCRLLYQSIRQVLLNVQLGRGFMQEQNRLPV